MRNRLYPQPIRACHCGPGVLSGQGHLTRAVLHSAGGAVHDGDWLMRDYRDCLVDNEPMVRSETRATSNVPNCSGPDGPGSSQLHRRCKHGHTVVQLVQCTVTAEDVATATLLYTVKVSPPTYSAQTFSIPRTECAFYIGFPASIGNPSNHRPTDSWRRGSKHGVNSTSPGNRDRLLHEPVWFSRAVYQTNTNRDIQARVCTLWLPFHPRGHRVQFPLAPFSDTLHDRTQWTHQSALVLPRRVGKSVNSCLSGLWLPASSTSPRLPSKGPSWFGTVDYRE